MIAAMWSGGKDSTMAVWRAMNSGIGVSRIVCMLYRGRSRAHGFGADVVRRQSGAMGIHVIFGDGERYAESLAEIVRRYGFEAIVFGDIYLEEHRSWIERFCGEVGVKPIFPLWGEDTERLAREFVDLGFEAYVVAAKPEYRWLLGRRFDHALIDELIDQGIDPCGEEGEFHTLAVSGPLFSGRIEFEFGGVIERGEYLILEVQ